MNIETFTSDGLWECRKKGSNKNRAATAWSLLPIALSFLPTFPPPWAVAPPESRYN